MGKQGRTRKGQQGGVGRRTGATGRLARLWQNGVDFFSGRPPAAPRAFSLGERTPPPAPRPQKLREPLKPDDLSFDIAVNLERVKDQFHYPASSDVIVREFAIGLTPAVRAFIVYIEGLADRKTAIDAILEPLMVLTKLQPGLSRRELLGAAKERLVPGTQIEELHSYDEVFEAALTGTSVLFIDGFDAAINIETKGWEHRSVERPLTEVTIQGPQDAFTETLRINTALVRRRIRSTNLIVESIRVGHYSNTDVAILHIDGLTNPKLVAEVRRRISSLDIDALGGSDILQQLIQDSGQSIFPQINTTERPDRVAAFLLEGYVAVLVDNSPFGLTLPSTFTMFLHNPEDYYLRWPFGTFMRIIRVLGIMTAVFLPAIYISVANYHPEMIPTSLLFAIAASREAVPFPVFVEVLLMEVAFELVREAGTRIPSVIGPTIGIVGALILGQAAVSASIVSPILVIIVALTALGSFTVPNYQASWSVRVVRFAFILLAAFMGFVGIAFGIFLIAVHLVTLQSFGVPYMSPIAPYRPGSPDIVLRGAAWTMERRPSFLRSLNLERQPRITRKWDIPPETTDDDSRGVDRGGEQE